GDGRLQRVRGAGARAGPIYLPLSPNTRDERRIADVAFSGGDVRNLLPIVDSMRVVKDSDEVARLRRAVDISVAGHIAAMRATRPGMYEYEIEAVLEDGFRRNAADRVGYPSSVGSGPNSTTLHYDVNRRKTENGDLVVIDAAAEWGQYTADVTRTFPVNGKFTPRQKAIYDLVLGAQQAAFDALRPGVTMRELDGIARRYMHDHSGNLCGERTCDDLVSAVSLALAMGCTRGVVGGDPILTLSDTNGTSQVFEVSDPQVTTAISNAFQGNRYWLGSAVDHEREVPPVRS